MGTNTKQSDDEIEVEYVDSKSVVLSFGEQIKLSLWQYVSLFIIMVLFFSSTQRTRRNEITTDRAEPKRTLRTKVRKERDNGFEFRNSFAVEIQQN